MGTVYTVRTRYHSGGVARQRVFCTDEEARAEVRRELQRVDPLKCYVETIWRAAADEEVTRGS